ncbi:MAG: GNAT family N-acetyltransferase [Bacteroidetes bacterium]|nr:GNAT family N-acetyltransferase [Bacteroidota bacterium]MCW5894365.1 GNAT family N-acetyltransferase [Bacteroidota bacterium]
MNLSIRKTVQADYDSVTRLLESASLPTLGVADHFSNFLVAENGSGIVGAIGLEVYDDTGLLRSAVVDSSLQNKGVGSLLYNNLIEHAKQLGVRRLILLTITAEKYFEKKGFRKINPDSVAGPIRQSVEFSGVCPSHAACMELILKEDE